MEELKRYKSQDIKQILLELIQAE